jgi:hypothetical protein
MSTAISPYIAYEQAKCGIYPDARFLQGKRFKQWRKAIDERFPDEKLSVDHREEKKTILLPAMAFICCHPGYSNGGKDSRLADDYRWMVGVYTRYSKRFAAAGDADNSDLYERMRQELQECRQ